MGTAPKEKATDQTDPLEFRIGTRLKHTRLLNRLRLKDVAERASCSESMLSKIENDRAVPSLTTLHRLCKALNVSISVLLSDEQIRPWTIMRSSERQIIGLAQAPRGELTKAEVLVPYVEGRLLEGFIVIIEPGGHSGGALQHKGEEVGYVVEGQLELTIEQETHLLTTGDSFHFPSDIPHSYRNPGNVQMRAVWINTPPSF
jgi:transcriptional regulator with XRE-family HTH domain